MSPVVGTIYCECSGMVREAFNAYSGFRFMSCDLEPPEDGRTDYHIQGDALQAVLARPDSFAGVHWPCTFFTLAGVRWLYGGKGSTPDAARFKAMHASADGLAVILRHLLAKGVPFYLENPIMHGHARRAIAARVPWFATAPVQTVQPWHFGTWETKATRLWLHKLPPLVPTYRTKDECRAALGLPACAKPVPKVHLAPPGPDRTRERSRTLPTLAKAMAAQWTPYLALNPIFNT